MAYKRNLSFPLAPTFEDPGDKKRKRKKKSTITKNADGTFTKSRTRRSGDVVKKTIKPRKKTPSKPAVKPTPEPRMTKEQKAKEQAIMDAFDKKHGRGKYETRADRRARTKPDRDAVKEWKKLERKRKQKARVEKRQVKREVIRAEKGKSKKSRPSKSRVKLKGARPTNRGGGSEAKWCRPGAKGKRKPCKLNV